MTKNAVVTATYIDIPVGDIPKNSNFELGSTLYWSVSGGDAEVVDNNVASGNYALKITASGNTSRIEQVVQVQGDTDYVLSAKIKADSGAWSYIGAAENTPPEICATGTAYTNVELPVHTNSGQTSITVYISVWRNQSGFVYVDDVYLAGGISVDEYQLEVLDLY